MAEFDFEAEENVDFSQVLELVAASENLDGLCQSLVFGRWPNAFFLGAFIYSLNRQAHLCFEAGFGSFRQDVEQRIDELWPLELQQAFRNRTHLAVSFSEYSQVFVPLVSKGLPVGVLALVGHVAQDQNSVLTLLLKHISQCVGFVLALGSTFSKTQSGTRGGKPDLGKITSRQLDVLTQMAQGSTNAEIAKNLFVSVSTVRHETIKIYEALEVGGRTEAVLVARKLGLVE